MTAPTSLSQDRICYRSDLPNFLALTMIFTLLSVLTTSFLCTEVTSQTTTVKNTACPPDWALIGEHCYLSLEATSSWEDANVRCHSFGGYTLVLESVDEFNAINNIFPITNVWLGCTSRYNMSVWKCNGENYTNAFNSSKLNVNSGKATCMHIKIDQFLRNVDCTKQKNVICEGIPELLQASHFGSDCPHGWIRHESQCYFQGGIRLSWERSQMYCEAFGGNLVTIDTEEELIAITDVFRPDKDWIGCRDHNALKQYLCSWENMTSIIEWALYEPKKFAACVAINSQFLMVTQSCTSPRDFICEVVLSELNVGIIGECPPRWIRANDTCYFYSYSQMTWDEANEYCKDAVSQLVVPETVTERDIVRNLFPVNSVWIGCKKPNGSNELQCQGNWTAFIDFVENVTTSGIVGEHCLVMGKAGYYMRVNCSSTERNFVCQMPKDQYLGCNVDASQRALAGGFIKLKQDNNRKNCTAACRSFNYMFAGLQNHKYCYCGNEQYSRYGRRSDWECGSGCNGQKGQHCGGPQRSLVYKAPVGPKPAAVTRKYNLKYGKRLIVYIYTSLVTPTLITCAEACTSNDWCLSFNFCENGQEGGNSTTICELNTGIRGYVQSVQFPNDEFCTFGEVDL